MTDNTTIGTSDDLSDEATTIDPSIGELVHLDPHRLVIGDNVRDAADLNKSFLASLHEHGVLVPITARRLDDGQILVRNGQRRVLGAQNVGLPTVPVYVLRANASDEAAETIDRIVHQIVTNDQKRDLTDAQRARGIQQMIDAGLTVTKVARKLSVAKDIVKAAETAAQSSAALEALDCGQISLTEAAVLTEFDQDGPDVLARLVAAAGTTQFEHVVSQLRTERASAQALAAATAEYVDRGFTILDDGDRWGWKLDRVSLRHLQRVGDDGQAHDVDETAITDPQYWGVRLEEYFELVDIKTGEVVDEDAIDWDTEGDPDAAPAEGLRHADSVQERVAFAPEFFCLSPEVVGLQVTAAYQRNAEWAARDRSGESSTATIGVDNDDASEADREAARQRAEAEAAEADKRERRKVLALNKLGAAAVGVRRQFITTMLARKTPPKGAATFVADCLVRDSYLLTQHDGPATAADLLGIDAAAIHEAVSDLPAGSDNRAMVITLALVVGALHARTGKDAWRRPAPLREPGQDRIRYGRTVTSGDLLRFLAANGYTLSAVEQVVTGTRDSEGVYVEYLAEAGKE